MKLKVETAHKKSAELRSLATTEKSRTRSVNQGVDAMVDPMHQHACRLKKPWQWRRENYSRRQ
jgi:hypothetical protein